MRRLAAALAVLALVAGCVDPEKDAVPLPGSTYRVGPLQTDPKSELTLDILRTEEACLEAVGRDELDTCLPRVDRATGEVSLSFRLKDPRDGEVYRLPLASDMVQVSHMGSPVGEGARQAYELEPYGARRASQLFILLIDGSGSMWENDGERVKKVYSALKNPDVVKSFYPDEDVTTGVVLMRFTNGVVGLDGGSPVVLETPAQYKAMVEYMGTRAGGFTHLYDAVRYAVNDLNEVPAIKQWLTVQAAEPTIVALTDGFNNEAGDDLCATNAPRLEGLLEEVLVARQTKGLGDRPTIFTIGLGKAIRRNFEVPKGSTKVTASALCGNQAGRRINADLERYGIDNVSLAWIAQVGGGASFVKNNAQGLAEVFQEAAALRYEWYRVRYKVDGFFHRKSFDTRVRLLGFARAESTVTFYPSAWLDAPTPVTDGRWSEPRPFGSTLPLVMPLLGALVLVHFLGPSLFNARRAIFRQAIQAAPTPPTPPPAAGAPGDPNAPPPQA